MIIVEFMNINNVSAMQVRASFYIFLNVQSLVALNACWARCVGQVWELGVGARCGGYSDSIHDDR